MRRAVLLVLVLLVATVSATDQLWCPDGCLETATVAADPDYSGATSGGCLLCANGVHPGPQLPAMLASEVARDATPALPQRIPMTPPRPIDHPPA